VSPGDEARVMRGVDSCDALRWGVVSYLMDIG
jgi:hypothetical protein